MCRMQDDSHQGSVSSSSSETSDTRSSSPASTATAAAAIPSNGPIKGQQFVRGLANDGQEINGSLRPKYDIVDEPTVDTDSTKAEKRPALIGIKGKWYDASSFAPHHPGGDIIYEFHNHDATAQFLAYHDSKILGDRIRLKVQGEYDYDMEKPGGSSFQGAWMKLNDKFEKEGRYKTPISFLFWHAGIVAMSFVLMMIMIHLYNTSRNPLAFVAGAVFMALIWQQSGFLMHDTMHNHIFHDRVADQNLGFLFGNILVGISGKWWRDEHSEHHIFTNTVIEGVGPTDPQMVEDVWIQDEKLIPFFVRAPVKFILEYQQYYFVPLCAVTGLFFVKIDGIVHTARFMDFVGLALHIGWVATVLSYLPSAKEIAVFYFASNFFSGCLVVQLLVSHYAKPWSNKEDSKQAGSWAARQIEAVMDITCPPYQDWFHGGLHIHSVHHLFPRMCRYHYRDVYDDIIGMCDDHGVPLDRFPWFEAIGRCVQRLGTIKEKSD